MIRRLWKLNHASHIFSGGRLFCCKQGFGLGRVFPNEDRYLAPVMADRSAECEEQQISSWTERELQKMIFPFSRTDNQNRLFARWKGGWAMPKHVVPPRMSSRPEHVNKLSSSVPLERRSRLIEEFRGWRASI